MPVNGLTAQRKEPGPTAFLTPEESPNFSQSKVEMNDLLMGTCVLRMSLS